MKQLRGVLHLVRDAVEHGSAAVERLQKHAASTPFRVLEALPPVAVPARQVHALHDAAVSGIHGLVRLVNRGVSVAADKTLDVLEARKAAQAPASGSEGRTS
ncbi:MAG TPA: hypothetical protein VFO83_00650 [Aggregicoccus sp.]|nr:hypothetical protein [Aggregicoccus sp.]